MRKTIPLVLLIACPLAAQVAADANRHYSNEKSRAVMVENLSDPERLTRLQGERIISSLPVKPGMTVADIGTGAGVMLPLFSKAVGPSGKVISQDIFPDFLETARRNARKQGLANVEFVLGAEKDTKLPPGCCDLAVTIDSYHHFDYPQEMLASIARGLNPGGQLVIVDYYKRPGAMGPRTDAVEHVRLDMDDVIKEVEANGFQLIEAREHVPRSQWIGFFKPRR
jgi:ubiquinone/menaquinone biosynthesis C-methylase UbiE